MCILFLLAQKKYLIKNAKLEQSTLGGSKNSSGNYKLFHT
jgi:hypothetical protein